MGSEQSLFHSDNKCGTGFHADAGGVGVHKNGYFARTTGAEASVGYQMKNGLEFSG